METEIWKEIESHPDYKISNMGRVSGKRVNFLKPCLFRGYPKVFLQKDGRFSRKTIHSLVLAAFISPRPRGHVSRHKNGIKTDNRAENLEWGTQKQNMQDKYQHGTAFLGERHALAKLKKEDVLEIRRLYKRVSYGKSNARELATRFKVSKENINHIVRRQGWATT